MKAMNMGKFSMFKNIEDLEEKREHYNESEYDIFSDLVKEEPTATEFYCAINPSTSCSDQLTYLPARFDCLENQRCFLSKYKDVLKKVMDIDAFLWINYTCDYLLLDNDSTEIKEFDLEDASVIELLKKAKKNILSNTIINCKIIVQKETGGIAKIIVPSELCCGDFFKYILNNLRKGPMYRKELSDRNRFLYTNVYDSKIDENELNYSFNFLYETIIGLNFSTTLSVLLYNYVYAQIIDDICDKDNNTAEIIEIRCMLNSIIGFKEKAGFMNHSLCALLNLIFENIPSDVLNDNNQGFYIILKCFREYLERLFYKRHIEGIFTEYSYNKFFKIHNGFRGRKLNFNDIIAKVQEKNIANFAKEEPIVFETKKVKHKLVASKLIVDRYTQAIAQNNLTHKAVNNKNDKLNMYIQKQIMFPTTDILYHSDIIRKK